MQVIQGRSSFDLSSIPNHPHEVLLNNNYFYFFSMKNQIVASPDQPLKTPVKLSHNLRLFEVKLETLFTPDAQPAPL